jgi:hypothetical protein
MSLWLQSLSFCLHDAEDDLELKAKCIFSYLSMDIPRFWWEQALKTNNIQSSYASIVYDLKKELLNKPELVGKINSGLLVALAFADKEGTKASFGDIDSPYSIKEYLDKAKEILIERPELGKLGKLIDNIGKHKISLQDGD